MDTLKIRWAPRINWALARTGHPHFCVTPPSNNPRDTIEAEIKSRGIILASGIVSSPQAEADTPRPTPFVWSWNEACRFLGAPSPSEAVLKLTCCPVLSGAASPTCVLETPLEITPTETWDSGISLVKSNPPQFDLLRSCPEIALQVPSQLPPVPGSRSLTSEEAETFVMSLAAFCLPRHPVIEELKDNVIEALANTGLELPLSNPGANERERFFATLYTTLWKRAPTLRRGPIPIPFDRTLAYRVILPDELRKNPVRVLSCIDWALILAGVCEAQSLSPIILLTRIDAGLYAIAAIPRVDRATPTKPVRRCTGAEGRRFLSEFLAVDFGIREGFEAARTQPLRILENADFCIAIDIGAARTHGCAPLDLMSPTGHLSSFAERYTAEVGGYLADFVSEKTRDGRTSPLDIFVPMEWTQDGENHYFPAEATYFQRATNPASKIMILGNSGTGKSYLLAKLFLASVQLFKQDPDHAKIPIFFACRQYFRGRDIFDHFLECLTPFGFPRDRARFQDLLHQGRFELYIDALDELRAGFAVSAAKRLETFAPLLAIPRLSVLLTSRAGLFSADELSRLADAGIATTLRLREWGHDHWLEFLRQHEVRGLLLPDEASRLKALGGETYKLTTKPLFCRMILAERDYLLHHDVRSEAELFHRYVDGFWEQQAQAHGDSWTPVEGNLCMQRLASKMERDGRMIWKVSEISDFLNSEYPDKRSRDDWQKWVTTVRISSFLDASVSHQREDLFSFSHEAFREFFLAQCIVEALVHATGHQVQLLRDIKIVDEVATMVTGLLALEKRPQTLLQRISGMLTTVMMRRNVALISIRSQRSCPPIDLCRANFSHLTFAGISFADARLDHADFEKSTFRSCTFPKSLRRAVFNRAHLVDCSFRGANLHGSRFHFATLRKCSFEGSIVTSAEFDGADLDEDSSDSIKQAGGAS